MIANRQTRWSDSTGSVTVELALVAPVLALMIIGVADLSTAFGRKLELEQGAQRAIEKVMQTTGSSTVAETLAEEAVCQVNGTAQDGSCAAGRLTTDDVTVSYRLECISGDGSRTESTSEDVDEFDGLSCDPGAREARYLSVTLVSEYVPMFPIKFGAQANGTYHMSATAGVRTQ